MFLQNTLKVALLSIRRFQFRQMATNRAVIFDLDGTLIDSLGDLADSMNAVLKEDSLPTHPVDSFRYFIGDGVVNLVKRALPKEKHDPEILESYVERYRASYAKRWDQSPLFPGIAHLLDNLKSLRIPAAVVSNKPDVFTQQCVEKLLPRWSWVTVIGQSDRFPSKPDPAMAIHAAESTGAPVEKCLFVGDSDVDMRTGKNAGMTSIGVAWGFRPISELQDAGADHIIEDPESLLELL